MQRPMSCSVHILRENLHLLLQHSALAAEHTLGAVTAGTLVYEMCASSQTTLQMF